MSEAIADVSLRYKILPAGIQAAYPRHVDVQQDGVKM